MITRDVLDNLAKKLMFKMNDEEYKTLENEFAWEYMFCATFIFQTRSERV